MAFPPTGSATATPSTNPQAQAKGDIGATWPIGMTTSSRFAPVYTNSRPMATHAQGGFMIGFPVGWNPAIGYGMPQEYMVSSSAGQPSSSASQPMNQQAYV